MNSNCIQFKVDIVCAHQTGVGCNQQTEKLSLPHNKIKDGTRTMPENARQTKDALYSIIGDQSTRQRTIHISDPEHNKRQLPKGPLDSHPNGELATKRLRLQVRLSRQGGSQRPAMARGLNAGVPGDAAYLEAPGT